MFVIMKNNVCKIKILQVIFLITVSMILQNMQVNEICR